MAPSTRPPVRLRRLAAGTAAAAVASLLVGGLVAVGGAAPALAADQIVITPSLLDTSATRATGHVDVLADGVRVRTEGATSTDKAAGYFDVDLPLAQVGEPTLAWTGSAARPGLQLTTDFDGDGDVDGVLVGEPGAYGDKWWVGSVDDAATLSAPGTPAEGGGGGPLNGTLAQWRAAYPSAQVLQSGFSLGSGVQGDGVVYGITLGEREYLFSSEEESTTRVLYPSDVDTRETRATGHNDFRITSGVRVWTEGATSTDKAAGYFAVDRPLRAVGEPSMQWRANGANVLRPGLQLVVDIDGDDAPDGILVGERTYADGTRLYQEPNGLTNWWATNGSKAALKALAPSTSGGYGSNANGSLAEWRAKLPAGTRVLAAGWSLGSGVKGDGVIERIVVGTTAYTFTGRNRAPEAAPVLLTLPAGTSAVADLAGSDPDGDTLTYRVDGVVVPQGRYVYTAPRGFVGTTTLAYTVTDGGGATQSGTVQIEVVRAASVATLRTGPAKPTTRSKVRLRVRVYSTGLVDGGVVGVHVDGRGVATARVVDGLAKVVLPKRLKRGTHVIRIRFRGTATTEPVELTRRIRVR